MNKDKFNPTESDIKDKQAAALISYRDNYANISKICKDVSIARSTWYEWKRKKSFRNKIEKIRLLLVAELEDQAISRSFEGSDTMLKFLLTKLCPDKYGDKLTLESEGTFEKLVMEIYAETRDQEPATEPVAPKTVH